LPVNVRSNSTRADARARVLHPAREGERLLLGVRRLNFRGSLRALDFPNLTLTWPWSSIVVHFLVQLLGQLPAEIPTEPREERHTVPNKAIVERPHMARSHAPRKQHPSHHRAWVQSHRWIGEKAKAQAPQGKDPLPLGHLPTVRPSDAYV
jgi:hypothetical protein